MLRVFDYECPECGDIQEHMIRGDEVPNCDLCCVSMRRLPAAPRLDYNGFWLAGMESGDRWNKVRRSRQKLEERSLERHGTYSHTGQSSAWDKTELVNERGERLKKVQ
jgi:predicted nucleic acid-binding Zn ribbon protein